MSEEIAQVRRFNRLVTQRVGALNDRFLARDRPLGQSRLLWEIGPDGAELRTLRTRLDLDSGYASRLLRSLEAAGLVTLGASGSDARARWAQLTSAGLAERELLDERSDELAASMLQPLSASQRGRLVAAMAEAEHLLTAAMVEIEPTDPDHPHARHCLERYFAEINERFDFGFDPQHSLLPDVSGLRPPDGLVLVARLHSVPVGCVALKLPPGPTAEIKRMWVSGDVRGLGLGRRMLSTAEDHAARLGATRVQLETNRVLLEAIALYRSAGYVEVPPYNDEPYADHWFEKPLTAAPAR